MFCIIGLGASCTSEHQEMEDFANALGAEKMEALNALVASFDQFLLQRYPVNTSPSEKSYQFLNDVSHRRSLNLSQVRGRDLLVAKLEDSGLRKDIYIYESEKATYPNYPVDQLMPVEYPEESMELSLNDKRFQFLLTSSNAEEVPSDSTLRYNKEGLFMYAMAKSKQKDQDFMRYVEVKYKLEDIHAVMIAQRHLENLAGKEFTWFQKLPIVIDIYYRMLLSDEKEEPNYLSMNNQPK
ncbi:hypothetical protein IFO69_08205 [Echinicola sp. CAU 1574]|uniref:Uncharacterized protein n=1 Tax=Echinicola arenosa TaxID=2774144 RepID=A0ABR9AIV9_9BACT|nr:hypothetical protein [Echinicola arenosa]MBD8488723.1 hypothetical protein [Echinicola arenosa]